MAPSAEAARGRRRPLRTFGALVIVLGAAGPLAGCTTTQTKAARLQLSDARIRAEGTPTRVGAVSTAVRATRIETVREDGRTALVVTVDNRGGDAVSDLPILVGYRLGGRETFLNRLVEDSYFGSHLPLIRAAGTLQWVFTTPRAIPRGATPVATIGARPAVSAGRLAGAPTIETVVKATTDGVARVTVRNTSGVTQYNLPLYLVAGQGGGSAGSTGAVTAAGTATLAQLGGGASATVKVHVTGRLDVAADDDLHVEAPPTIFK